MEDENENGPTFTYSIDPKSIRIIRIQKSVESDSEFFADIDYTLSGGEAAIRENAQAALREFTAAVAAREALDG